MTQLKRLTGALPTWFSGHVPTPEESEVLQAIWDEGTRRTALALLRLDAITDEPARKTLDLHARTFGYDSATTWRCPICEAEENADWPCRTVETIAGRYGIDLRYEWVPVNRPLDGSLDQPGHHKPWWQ